ncbi:MULTISPECIES: hypothetical protein [unclassified Microcoleus]|uniref:hypothetical protein n=1 Tax=unclassified Microcoleus TaxID=2642155 RepID=UPI002FCFCB89
MKCALAELQKIEAVQVTLSGLDIYCLIVAAQSLKAIQRFPRVDKIAETAAKKLCESLDSPLAREFLGEGWELTEELADPPNQQDL